MTRRQFTPLALWSVLLLGVGPLRAQSVQGTPPPRALALEAQAYAASTPRERSQALALLTEAYLAVGDGPSALEAALRADPSSLDPHARRALTIDRALAMSLAGQEGAAVQQLIILESDTGLTPGQAIELYRLLGRLLLAADQPLAARSKALNGLDRLALDEGQRRRRQQRMAATWDSIPPPRLRSARRARRLSMWVPPSGLLYARRPGTYALNLGLQAASVGYTAVNVLYGNYVTAGTVGVYLMRSFWVGGVGMAEGAVLYDNAVAQSAYRARLTTLIDQAYALPDDAPLNR